MKKYSIPELNISVFERENVVTSSGTGSNAFEEAKAAAANSGTQHTFTVELF